MTRSPDTPTDARVREVLESLRPRQLEVLAWLVEGRSNKEIGHQMYVTEMTVKRHMNSLLKAFGARTRSELAFVVASVRLVDWAWVMDREVERRARLRG